MEAAVLCTVIGAQLILAFKITLGIDSLVRVGRARRLDATGAALRDSAGH